MYFRGELLLVVINSRTNRCDNVGHSTEPPVISATVRAPAFGKKKRQSKTRVKTPTAGNESLFQLYNNHVFLFLFLKRPKGVGKRTRWNIRKNVVDIIITYTSAARDRDRRGRQLDASERYLMRFTRPRALPFIETHLFSPSPSDKW